MKIVKRFFTLATLFSFGITMFNCTESEEFDSTIYGYFPVENFEIIPDSLVYNDEKKEFEYVIDSVLRINYTYRISNSCEKYFSFDRINPKVDTADYTYDKSIKDSLYFGTLGSFKEFPRCKDEFKLITRIDSINITPTEDLETYNINLWTGIKLNADDTDDVYFNKYKSLKIKIRKPKQ